MAGRLRECLECYMSGQEVAQVLGGSVSALEVLSVHVRLHECLEVCVSVQGSMNWKG